MSLRNLLCTQLSHRCKDKTTGHFPLRFALSIFFLVLSTTSLLHRETSPQLLGPQLLSTTAMADGWWCDEEVPSNDARAEDEEDFVG